MSDVHGVTGVNCDTHVRELLHMLDMYLHTSLKVSNDPT